LKEDEKSNKPKERLVRMSIVSENCFITNVKKAREDSINKKEIEKMLDKDVEEKLENTNVQELKVSNKVPTR
jgi:hypothetical protein